MERRVAVVGGGISGVSACTFLSSMGLDVVLIEARNHLGGNLSHPKPLFPTMKNSAELLRENMKFDMKKVHLKTKIEKRRGNFRLSCTMGPIYVDAEKCTDCRKCINECTKEYPDEDYLGLVMRKPIKRYDGPIVSYDIERAKCRNGCRKCQEVCPKGAINLEAHEEKIEIDVDVVMLATGIDAYDMKKIKELNYENHRDIITSLEFERTYSPYGPLKGEIRRPSDGKKPELVAILTCIGSRDEKHMRYCCNVGCMNALNEALRIKDADSSIDVYVCYTDIRSHGKYHEEFYSDVRGLSVKMLRGKPSEIFIDHDGTLNFDIFDTSTHKLLKIKPEMIVMEPALINGDINGIGKILGVKEDSEGFYVPEDYLFSNGRTNVDGVFVAGCAAGPRDVINSIGHTISACRGVYEYLK